MKTGIFREEKLQSPSDLKQIEELSSYIQDSPGELIAKFDNFTKYIQRTTLSKFLARYEIFKMQIDTPGSVVELGVGRGASLMAWAQLSTIFEPVNYLRRIIGFDTFAGIPELDPKDINESNKDSKLMRVGGFKVEESIYEDIQKAISIYNINRPLGHLEKVQVIKGDINETLPKYLSENQQLIISLLNLDVDLYRPTKKAIELLFDRIPKGGIIIFDELNSVLFPGETVALKETLGINSLRFRRFPWATTISYAVLE